MNKVEEVENQLKENSNPGDSEENKSGEKNKQGKTHIGQLYQVYPYERFERKPRLKNLGRNDKCFCGSNKKYKKCCLPKMNFGNTYEIKENMSSTKRVQKTMEVKQSESESTEKEVKIES